MYSYTSICVLIFFITFFLCQWWWLCALLCHHSTGGRLSTQVVWVNGCNDLEFHELCVCVAQLAWPVDIIHPLIQWYTRKLFALMCRLLLRINRFPFDIDKMSVGHDIGSDEDKLVKTKNHQWKQVYRSIFGWVNSAEAKRRGRYHRTADPHWLRSALHSTVQWQSSRTKITGAWNVHSRSRKHIIIIHKKGLAIINSSHLYILSVCQNSPVGSDIAPSSSFQLQQLHLIRYICTFEICVYQMKEEIKKYCSLDDEIIRLCALNTLNVTGSSDGCVHRNTHI